MSSSMQMFFALILCLLSLLRGSAYQIPSIPRTFAKTVAAGVASTGIAFGGTLIADNMFFHGPAASLAKEYKSPFVGKYDDPNHPGCLRKIEVYTPSCYDILASFTNL